jgi:hypothetical protein
MIGDISILVVLNMLRSVIEHIKKLRRWSQGTRVANQIHNQVERNTNISLNNSISFEDPTTFPKFYDSLNVKARRAKRFDILDQ